MTEATSGELDQTAIFARLNRLAGSAQKIAVGLSGGADSMALTLLLKDWCDRQGTALAALTVDHRLRPEARREAEAMKDWCAGHGIPHTILTLEEDLPGTGIQEAARAARYRVLTECCERHGIAALFTAHHLDDQAETLLMRLSRGSGVDGLAGMGEVRPLSETVVLVRPLLDVPKRALQDFLLQSRERWIEDPANANPDFTRVRWRALMPGLAEEGLDASGLGRLARRMARASGALDWSTDRLVGEHLIRHETGYAELVDFTGLCTQIPEELALRLARRALLSVYPPASIRLERLERIVRLWRDGACDPHVLAGCRLIPDQRRNRLLVVRENRDLPDVRVERDCLIWDSRFELSGLVPGQYVRPLGEKGWAIVKNLGTGPFPPFEAAHPSPAVWDGEKPVATPFWAEKGCEIRFRMLDGPVCKNTSLIPGQESR